MHDPLRTFAAMTSLNHTCNVVERIAPCRRKSIFMNANASEEGAILILALIFVLIVSLSVLSLITFGGVGIKNTVNLKGQRNLEYAADGATSAAIQAVRYSYQTFSAYPPTDCLPDGAVFTSGDTVTITINSNIMVVDCTATVRPPNSLPVNSSTRPEDRVIAFYACTTLQLTASGGQPYCYAGNAIVAATVDFEDVSAGGFYECSNTNASTCGTGEAVESWAVQNANS